MAKMKYITNLPISKRLLHYTYISLLSILVASCSSALSTQTLQTAQVSQDEIQYLKQQLYKAMDTLDNKKSLEPALVAFSSIASRLEIFEIRFGIRPYQNKEYETIKNEAIKIIPKVEGLTKEGVYYNVDSAKVIYCIILGLAERTDDELKMFDSTEPSGWCRNCNASVLLSILQRKSGLYQEMGKYSNALEEHEKALKEVNFTLHFPDQDIFYTRYGFLLAKNGRKSDAIIQYQRVVDLFPRTIGSEVSNRELEEEKALIIPTAERLVQTYFRATNFTDIELAIFALARNRFPESFTILSDRLKNNETLNDFHSECERNRLIPALGMLGDKRAIPILADIMKTGDFANCIHALVALRELGETSQIDEFLEIMESGKGVSPYDLSWAHESLKKVCGGGPELSDDQLKSRMFIVNAWREWIEIHGCK